MYKNILIATDGSELSAKALHQGLKLAKALGAQVRVATATEPWEAVVVGEVAVVVTPQKYAETSARNAADVLAKAKAIADEEGVAIQALHVSERHPAEGIIEAAKENKCDLIVMASHGRRGLSRLLLGSQANEVVTHSSIPVLIVR
jgi:nucleotide-binding universal stress UspA family protein